MMCYSASRVNRLAEFTHYTDGRLGAGRDHPRRQFPPDSANTNVADDAAVVSRGTWLVDAVAT